MSSQNSALDATAGIASKGKIGFYLRVQQWLECADFIEADVIRFDDAVFERKGPAGHERSRKIGNRLVTAEVIGTYRDFRGTWVILKIVQCVVMDEKGRAIEPLKVGEEIKRLRSSLVRWGKPKRLPWSDEDNRAGRVADQETPEFRNYRKKR